MFKCRNQDFSNLKKLFPISRHNKYFWFNFYHFSNTSDYGKVNCSRLQINPIFYGLCSSLSSCFPQDLLLSRVLGNFRRPEIFLKFLWCFPSLLKVLWIFHIQCACQKSLFLLLATCRTREKSFQSIIVLRGKENVQHARFN